jgi:hypothetical protein
VVLSRTTQKTLNKTGGKPMAYNEEIERRINRIVLNWKNTARKKMFGGGCHLLNGNMYSGVYKDFLILRLDEEDFRNAQESPFVKPFDITGRLMKGWVMVEQGGFKTDPELEVWLSKVRRFVETLPPK